MTLPALAPAGHELGRRSLAGVSLQGRLGVKRVHVRRAAVHEQKDHSLGPCREVRRPWAPADWPSVVPAAASPVRTLRDALRQQSSGIGQDAGQSQGTKAAADSRKQSTPA